MNNLAEVCLVGLGVGANYVRFLVIVVIPMRLGGAKRCGEGFKVIILSVASGVGRGKWANHKEGASFYKGSRPLYTP